MGTEFLGRVMFVVAHKIWNSSYVHSSVSLLCKECFVTSSRLPIVIQRLESGKNKQ